MILCSCQNHIGKFTLVESIQGLDWASSFLQYYYYDI